jgi:hypothetical protein
MSSVDGFRCFWDIDDEDLSRGFQDDADDLSNTMFLEYHFQIAPRIPYMVFSVKQQGGYRYCLERCWYINGTPIMHGIIVVLMLQFLQRVERIHNQIIHLLQKPYLMVILIKHADDKILVV